MHLYVLIFLTASAFSLISAQEKNPKDSGSSAKVVRMKLQDAEEKFLKNNLQLLAQKFQIDGSRARILQARLYANPNIFIEQNIFNDKTERYFDFTRNGQTVVQIQQLFLLGGKIDKRIKVAEINTRISEEQFFDVLRALTYELRSSFIALYYLREATQFYDRSIEALRKTVENTEKAHKSRAILLAEVLRLKALLFFLENERTEIMVQVREKEASLRVLMNDATMIGKDIYPMINPKSLEEIDPENLSYNSFLETAMENRPDLKASIQGVKYEEANLALQKANAIPDLSFGPVYNRAGTYIPNYFGFTAQLNVPIFDRNQGNIEAAEKAILERRSHLENQRLQIQNEVAIDYNRAVEKNRIFQNFKGKFSEEYRDLALLMISNYQKRYLTIIEFADFFETYRTSIINLLKLQTERAAAIERLNYTAGKNIIIIQPGAE
ncbi:MAG TPA: TolC family protein [Leptospiraceae bacterium]|nr:TolC family protein [Leptospiraceae bacterium]HNF14983.1 TolC family protein [Leptospiraceae bacterium]HNF27410.1 TolC family protein [Leptospiraceae bacterium]HNI26820.1 TolC family protein [Leptospiraceae bacterium]HNI96089.1 TolC family protein [Leptospiraceae bacterium]